VHVPNGYKVLHKVTIKRMSAGQETIKSIADEEKQGRSILSDFDKVYVGTLASRFPQAKWRSDPANRDKAITAKIGRTFKAVSTAVFIPKEPKTNVRP
jgi:hypothetical protein